MYVSAALQVNVDEFMDSHFFYIFRKIDPLFA